MRDNEEMLPVGLERRVASVELRGARHAEKIVGYAAVFNSRSQDLGGFVEVIEKNAFRDAIGRSDIRALFNHNADLVLGRTSSGTLKVWEDDVGLWTETSPPDTQLVRDTVLEPMRRLDVTQMSFAFRVAPGGATIEDTDDGFVRTIRSGGVEELFDISPVVFPAYNDTSVAVRSMQNLKGHAERESLLAAIQRDNQLAQIKADIAGKHFPSPAERQAIIARMRSDIGSVPRTTCKPYKPKWPVRFG